MAQRNIHFNAAPQTQEPLENDRRTIMNIPSETRGFAFVVLLLPLLHSQATAAPGLQERRLLAPTGSQQRMGQQGEVRNYDGDHADTVDRALDTQSDQVRNMVLVGVPPTTDAGEEYADDDCD